MLHRSRPAQQPQQQQSHLLDLLDVNVSGATAGWVDPWGTPAHPSEPPVPVMPPRPKVCLLAQWRLAQTILAFLGFVPYLLLLLLLLFVSFFFGWQFPQHIKKGTSPEYQSIPWSLPPGFQSFSVQVTSFGVWSAGCRGIPFKGLSFIDCFSIYLILSGFYFQGKTYLTCYFIILFFSLNSGGLHVKIPFRVHHPSKKLT